MSFKTLKLKFVLIMTLVAALGSPAQATYIGTPNQVNLGGASTLPAMNLPETNPNGYFIIEFANLSSGLNNFYHFQKNGAVYQVTTGKTGVPIQICWAQNSAANVTLGQVITATNNFTEGAGTVTSPAYQFGADQRYGYLSAATGTYQCSPIGMTFAAQSYPGLQLGLATVRQHFYIVMKEI